ncbi:MAG: DNA repair protein RadC [Puniceicoccales bacterium]|nr:DNA repair protein RadC [Puniceicoccales bacterium]
MIMAVGFLFFYEKNVSLPSVITVHERQSSVSENTDNSVNHGHRSRLREKFLRSEFAGLCDYEIVELLLTLSIPRKDVKALAKKLLGTFGSLRNIFDAEVSDLTKVRGIGKSTAVALKVIRAVNVVYLREKLESGQVLDSSTKAIELWKNKLSNLKFEVVEVALLDSGLRLIKNGIERLETGTAAATTFYPRKIAEAAIRSNATAVIIAHNHPAGSAEPSDYDERSTRTIKTALQYLDVRLIDHVIISQNDAFSFKEHGLL